MRNPPFLNMDSKTRKQIATALLKAAKQIDLGSKAQASTDDAWLDRLAPPGKAKAIGPETGKLKPNGISQFKSPHGSVRYVFAEDGQILAALQLVTTDGRAAQAVSVFTKPEARRRGLARKLLEAARKDFESVALSEDRTDDGKQWADAVLRASTDGIWYHGSPKKFSSFQTFLKRTVQNEASETPLFFSKDRSFAEMYAGHHGFVYEVEMNVRNTFDGSSLYSPSRYWPPPDDKLTPLGKKLRDDLADNKVFRDLVTDDESDWAAFHDSQGTWASILKNHYDVLETKEMKEWMKASGFDSFYVTGDGPKNIAVLDPKDIKLLSVVPVTAA